MTAVGQADQGLTLLQFRRVLPTSAWLRASILWADKLAAIWPETGPRAMNHAQEQSQREIEQLEYANFFRPEYISGFSPESAAEVIADLERASASESLGEVWQDGALAAGPISPLTDRQLLEYDPHTFLYNEKLPDETIEQLVRLNLLRQRPDGHYVATSADLLDRVLAAYVSVLCDTYGGRLVPDIQVPAQARRIAAPDAGENRQALVISLMGAVTPDLVTPFERFIEFRQNDRNESARRDYIEQLTGLWDQFARGGPEHAVRQIVLQVTTDLQKARKSYFERVGAQLTAQGLGSLGVLIPLLAIHPPLAIVGAIASVGGSAVTVAVRKGAPTYVRAATKSELLAPTASL